MDMPTIGAGAPTSPTAVLPTIRPGAPGQNDPLPGPSGESQMTLVSPISDIKDAKDWAIVLGIVLVAEVVLLWGVACLSLLRRRLTLSRTGASSDATATAGATATAAAGAGGSAGSGARWWSLPRLRRS
ncbi:hypothetical protein EBO15_11895 [Actinomadura harenae]|uniref:Uncharacterized protein n=3 Tax=Actinomadura harenae TaxID=2483351 RepID=A0A3M2M7X4_9ACTN|nr:hypothetical protein EBO15_11895 [Actinomadura harenae]